MTIPIARRPAHECVNVSQVNQISPFRYPGGKTWFVPYVRRWLGDSKPPLFVEPFCGGGSVGLAVAAEGLAGHVLMSELDADVAAVWHVCLSADAGKLAQLIIGFRLTRDTAEAVIRSEPKDTLARAFRLIVFNRVSRGGITAKGAGILKRGENDNGIASRWYPETLAARISCVAAMRDRVSFHEDDAFNVIDRHPDGVFYVDPPYTAGAGKRAGRRLYRHHEIDHPRLFDRMRGIDRLLMTYDDDPDVIAMAERRGFYVDRVPMKSTHHRQAVELVIRKDAP